MATWWSTHRSIGVILRALSVTPVFVVQDGIRWHRHVVVSNIKLALSFELLSLMHVESHCSDIILRNVHFVRSLLVLRWKLLAHVCPSIVQSLTVHSLVSLVLCQRAACKVCLVHLCWVHLLAIWPHHIHRGAASTAIWCSTGIWHSSNEALALQSHAHWHIVANHVASKLVHCLQWINLLIDHVINANLWFSSALLRGHWQMVRLVHCVLVLRFLCIQPIILCVRILHDLMHLDFVSYTWWRVWILKIVQGLLIRVLLMNIVLWPPWSLATWIWVNTSNSLARGVSPLVRWTKVVVERNLCLSSSWLGAVLLWNIDSAPSMASLAYSTSFGCLAWRSSFIAFKWPLSVHWGQQRIVIARARLVTVASAASILLQIDVVVVVLVLGVFWVLTGYASTILVTRVSTTRHIIVSIHAWTCDVLD